MDSFISFDRVSKIYQMGDVEIKALDEISFDINEGEFVIIVGASGAGKSTLLNLIGGMDTLTKGEIRVDDEIISNYSAKELTKYRREDIGFVFQFYNLVQNLTALENVELATEIGIEPFDERETLIQVGLEDRIDNFPSQLSGGEQQRVAIARAISKNPKLLLCDEPTGALDYETGRQILKLLQDITRKNNKTVIVVTHNSALTPIADRVIKMRSGKISDIYINEDPVDIGRIEW